MKKQIAEILNVKKQDGFMTEIKKDNKKTSNVPNLRFPEFVGEWEVKKLGEVAEIKTGNKDTQNKVDDGIYPFFVRSNTVERINSYSFDGEAILTSGDGVGVGKNFHYINGKFDFHQRVYSLKKFKEGYSGKYIYYIFSEKFYDRVIKLSAKNSVDSVRMDMITSMQIYFPSFLEQQKIATFLSLLDERITTQKKIIEELNVSKNAITQKIFSRRLKFKDENGNNFPDWESKRLGDIGCFQTSSIDKLSKDNEKEVFLVNYMDVYRHENINNETIKSFQIVTAKDTQIENCNLKKGDILFTPSSETADDIGHSVVIFENLENAVFSYHLMRFRPKTELDILYSHYFCNVSSVLNQLSKLATGSTRFTISVKSFSSVEILLPCVAEQIKIANFLSSIDSKIDTENQLLQKLEKQKKYLLQNMFV